MFNFKFIKPYYPEVEILVLFNLSRSTLLRYREECLKDGGEPILSHTISLRTVESEIANSLTKVQDQNKDVEIGSYPFFHAGKLGVSIVLRSEDQSKIDNCNSQILEFINDKKIEVVDR